MRKSKIKVTLKLLLVFRIGIISPFYKEIFIPLKQKKSVFYIS